jgi:hypothetical protein
MLWRELGSPVDQYLTFDQGLTINTGSLFQTPQLQFTGRPGVQLGGSSSRRPLVGQPVLSSALTSVLTEVQPAVMGVDLLNPVWERVQFGSSSSNSREHMLHTQQPTIAAAAAAAAGAAGCGCSGPQCTGGTSRPEPGGDGTGQVNLGAYYSPHLGRVTQEVPPGCDWCRGGILAEEMGEWRLAAADSWLIIVNVTHFAQGLTVVDIAQWKVMPTSHDCRLQLMNVL